MKSTSYEQDNDQGDENFQSKDIFATTDPFESNASLTGNDGDGRGFNTIMGNNNISNNPIMFGYHPNGGYDHSNDFLMNFYASQCTNYSPFMANSCNIVPTLTNIHHHPSPLLTNSSSLKNSSCSSSYNPFHQHYCVITTNNASIQDGDNDLNSNNDNWANFDSSVDNFADFDSHFANMTPASFNSAVNQELGTCEEFSQGDPPCFVSTTQVLEISSVPPTSAIQQELEQQPQELSPVKFQLGPNPAPIDALILPATTLNNIIKSFDELEDEEFFSLRDDSNDMSSLTDDFEKKLTFENTEVPDDDDDDFASADER